ncbi:hypothetical protein J7K60_04230 [Candidatus Bipolaricaulota bacterium]|nr:hypothetical protein [Candidatus Bipolaricaulota bacterium]
MRRKRSIAVLAAILLGAVVLVSFASPSRYAIASAEELRSFTHVASDDNLQAEHQLFAVLLSGTDLVVIMRPLTESEYASFQVQAIGYQIIEQEMLAAAIVMPVATPADVAAFSSDLVTFLQQQVNEISGFDVFNVIPPDAH